MASRGEEEEEDDDEEKEEEEEVKQTWCLTSTETIRLIRDG